MTLIAVLDASALLAHMQNEPGSDKVTDMLPYSVISSVNRSEVFSKLLDKGFSESSIFETLKTYETTGLKTIPFDQDSADKAGLLRPKTKALGLSLADRACISLGLKLNLVIVSADKSWKHLERSVDGITILLIR